MWTTEKIMNADSSKGFAQQRTPGYLTAVTSGQQQQQHPLFSSQDDLLNLFFLEVDSFFLFLAISVNFSCQNLNSCYGYTLSTFAEQLTANSILIIKVRTKFTLKLKILVFLFNCDIKSALTDREEFLSS